MRSSSCFLSASTAGSWVPCFFSCAVTVAIRSFKSFMVITSLLTTATIRSSSITPPGFTVAVRLVSSFGAGGVNSGFVAAPGANGACAVTIDTLPTNSAADTSWQMRNKR